MQQRPDLVRALEDRFVATSQLTHAQAMRIYEGLWEEARRARCRAGRRPLARDRGGPADRTHPGHMFTELLIRLGDAFVRHGLPYMVIGGQAVLVHGEPRLTRDIDITVGVGVDGIDRVLSLVAELGLKPLPDDPRAFALETMVVPAVDQGSGIRVDLILSFTPYEAEAIGRAQEVPMGTGSVRVATAEDLVVLKIFAGRPRDLEDVRMILVRKPDLDRAYVQRWLTVFEEGTKRESGVSPLDTFARIEHEVR